MSRKLVCSLTGAVRDRRTSVCDIRPRVSASHARTQTHTCTCTHAGTQTGTSLGHLSDNFLLCGDNTNNTVYIKPRTT